MTSWVKVRSVTSIGWDGAGPLTGKGLRHLPHIGRSPFLSPGIRFLAPQRGQATMKESLLIGGFLSGGQYRRQAVFSFKV
jgi:hypothetical protein